jgi:hypothetical protein
VQAEIQRGLGATESSLVLIDQAIRLAHDQTSGLPQADHMAALGSQAALHLNATSDTCKPRWSASEKRSVPRANYGSRWS